MIPYIPWPLEIALCIAIAGIITLIIDRPFKQKTVIVQEVARYEKFTIDEDGTLNFRKE